MRPTRVRRHSFAFRLSLAAALLPFAAAPATAKKVIVLGFDGLDPDIVRQLVDEGRLPNMARLAKEGGGLHDLATSIPPQSPVAWSNFITGMDSGGHGIFDFLHRDAKTYIPYLSTSKPIESEEEPFKLGGYCIPRGGGGFELLRHGTAFWETLEQNGVPCMIVRMPANFPVSGKATYELSGMGTPDVRGTYGTFSFYTTDHAEFAGKNVGGGSIYNVTLVGGQATCKLEGPTNPLLCNEKTRAFVEFTVDVDPDEDWVLLTLEGEEHLLGAGEWTEWLPIELPFAPNAALSLVAPPVRVMARFYVKQVHPHLKIYVSPMNYDPMYATSDFATPPSFAKELAEAAGRFATQGMPEDTKALDEHVFTVDEFLVQAGNAGREVLDEFPWVLDKFQREFPDQGCLFYYTGNHDQTGHMLYRTMDPSHPTYDPAVHAQYGEVMPRIIEGFDRLVGYALERIDDDTTLIIMSDHGFASWRRAMNVNSWLASEGYLTLKTPNIEKDPGFFLNVDWTKTRAYALGLNGLYVNVRGREAKGIVPESERRGLLEEIAYKLVQLKDPETGLQAVSKVYLCEDSYHDRGHLDVGPDMIVGFAREMRSSNQSATGTIPPDVFKNCDTEWSADHCMDHTVVAGVLMSNRPLAKPAPALHNLAAAILAEFGIGEFPGDAEKDLEAVGYISATATH
jgi:predicted AlkP superfamily phosphohydrolase/phosphomutase